MIEYRILVVCIIFSIRMQGCMTLGEYEIEIDYCGTHLEEVVAGEYKLI